MARNGWSDSNYMTHASRVLSADRPSSLSCWIKPSTNTDTVASYTHWLWKNCDLLSGLSPNLGFSVKSSGTVLNVFADGTSASSSSFTASTDWYQVGYSWASDDTLKFYRNGSLLSTTSLVVGAGTPTGNSIIGALKTANIIAQCAIAELGVWDVILTDAEFATLGAAYAPTFVRPASLLSYPDMVRGDGDRIAGSLTVTGTIGVADHPRVIYPRRKQVVVASAAAPASAVGHYYRNHLMARRRAS